MIIPTKEECLKILKDSNVPDNVIAHSKAVCNVALKIADLLEKRGINVNKDLVAAGALLHDIKKINSNDHVIEGADFVKALGFPEVALVIRKHGLTHLQNDDFFPKSWEEKIVFYADKRAKNDKIVSVEERFEYIKERYNREEIALTKKIER